MALHRIGLIVPSSNITVETELPALLHRHPSADFSFHSTRMRMHTVSAAQLASMNAQRERCTMEIADASPDVILYACLVAVMVGGPGEHRRVEGAIAEQLAAGGSAAKIRSSAGALVQALRAIDADRIALVTPYMRPLAAQVVGYLESEEFELADWRALEVADNAEVGCIPGERVLEAARSLDPIDPAEEEFGIPVLSAATAGAYSILRSLTLPVAIPGAGSLLRADTVPAAA